MTSLDEIREIKNLEEMRGFAFELASKIHPDDRLLLLLDGEMGSGKTQFTRFFVEALGSHETVSPSFAIHNRYKTGMGSVDHIDLYRLESEQDLESTGFWDLFLEKKGIVIVEWADRLREFDLLEQLPLSWPKKHLQFIFSGRGGQEQRTVKLR